MVSLQFLLSEDGQLLAFIFLSIGLTSLSKGNNKCLFALILVFIHAFEEIYIIRQIYNSDIDLAEFVI